MSGAGDKVPPSPGGESGNSSTTVSKLSTVLRKALAFNSQPSENSFPELPDVLVWVRFGLAAAYGYFAGTRGVRSGILPLQAFNLIVFVPVVYCRLYLMAPAGVFPGKTVFAGSFQALALFLLIWIYFYTLLHEDDEMKLAAMLVNSSAGSVDEAASAATQDPMSGGGVRGGETQQEQEAAVNIGMEDHEF